MDQNDTVVIVGTVDTVIYKNEENGYAVLGLDTEDGDSMITVGTFPFVNEGDNVTVYGTYINHPSYGKQLKATTFEKTLPTGTKAIRKYLSSGAIRGVGPKIAERIVKEFGADTFDVIENHPDWLADIQGISPKKAQAISDGFRESTGMRQIMTFCQNYLSTSQTLRIYQRWGLDSVDQIRANPYFLCREFSSISFKSADMIAAAAGIEPNDPNRIAGGLLFILEEEAQRSGHTCLPEEELLASAGELLGESVTGEEISVGISRLLKTGDLHVLRYGDSLLISKDNYFQAEKTIAKKLTYINRMCPVVSTEDSKRLILQIEHTTGILFNQLQRDAFLTALQHGVMILTGGPGTGKTTVIKGLLSMFESMDLETALAAPTGRAAKRMSESTAAEAFTIHRLLEMGRNESEDPKFQRNEKNPLTEDVFIIDEASMMDVLLMQALLKAIRPGAKLILIGDSDQLPSVGAGNVLGDLLSSGLFPTVCLKEIFRQEKDSMIVMNAHAICQGDYPVLDNRSKDFFFMKRQTPEEISAAVVALFKDRLPNAYGDLASPERIQVITPSHKGVSGTIRLNNLLQEAINPGKKNVPEKVSHGVTFRVGDKVMQLRNNYDLCWEKDDQEGVGVFNGDIGVIEDINFAAEQMIIRFDDRMVNYDFTALEDLGLAYAITVHKSQGCEYPIVIMPVYPCAPMLMTRNLFYTAVTRAGQMVILVGREDIIRHMVDNNQHARRCTALPAFLEKLEVTGIR